MVVEMPLQSTVLTQLVIQIELTDDIGGVAGVVARHQAYIGLNNQAVFKQLGPQGHLIFVEGVNVSIVIAEAQIQVLGDIELHLGREEAPNIHVL